MEKINMIKDIADEFAACTSEIAENKVLKEIEIIHYLPIMDKVRLINETLNSKVIENSDDWITYSSVDKMIFFMLSVIEGYTNMKVNKPLADFDSLMESGLMIAILKEIGDDVNVYQDMFDMTLNDLVRDNNSLPVIVGKKIYDIGVSLEDVVQNVLKQTAENGSLEQLMEVLKDINKD